ncbi:hypothetical protein [Rufibacter latericius]|uniref:Uncharacterized protein n=1 Tax=Rufibacter latericius TaxID=2487040 RepID=A0A3M9MDT7_9BACT|nr:hypothetical protein [Rufibacter latericius]RNI23365.1 hypothetical protein EFB08_17610 [Rufibacter latericius]
MQKEPYQMQKIMTNLWKNLQKHLLEIYAVEKMFDNSLIVAEKFPFNPAYVEPEKLESFMQCRTNLRDLFIDEVSQLSILVKTIRSKNYNEEDKKQLFMLLLGYLDVASTALGKLQEYTHTKLPIDLELENTLTAFDKLKKFTRLNIKGIHP